MAARPICAVCHVDLSLADLSGIDGDLVVFADHTTLPHGCAGEPPGQAWFCSAHLVAAQAHARLPLREAQGLLTHRYGAPPEGVRDHLQVWVDSLCGVSSLQVMKVIRAATGCSPSEAKALIADLPTCLLSPPRGHEHLAAHLVDELAALGVGSRVEVVAPHS